MYSGSNPLQTSRIRKSRATAFGIFFWHNPSLLGGMHKKNYDHSAGVGIE
jgi:hypothetical protein